MQNPFKLDSGCFCSNLLLTFALMFFSIHLFAQNHDATDEIKERLKEMGVDVNAPVPPMNATSITNSVINVDCSVILGEFSHPEKYNNFSHNRAFVEQRNTDVKFYNEQGLHGRIYRVWLGGNTYYDEKTGRVDLSDMSEYLSDASIVSDYLLVNCSHLGDVKGWEVSQEEKVVRLAKILTELKKSFPKIKYIEATNEPDYANEGLTPDNYYKAYQAYYKAVNKVNAELKPVVPLLVGGPSTAQFSLTWLRAFLDAFKNDPSPDKRIDFISYHGYFTKPGEAYVMFKDNPSLVNDQRKLLNAELAQRGMNTDIPVFITEMGLYPGPSFDDFVTMKNDHLRQAAGMASLFYWYMNSENTYPFNWVFRHQTEGRKDQLVSRDEKGNPFVQTNKFTPYGNILLMMSKMKKERISAITSTEIKEGKGLYTLASKDSSGVSVMIWNYQSKNTVGFNAEIKVNSLNASFRNKNVKVKTYRIDSSTSNFHASLDKSNLQLVDEKVVQHKGTYSTSLHLEPNTILLYVIEPVIKK